MLFPDKHMTNRQLFDATQAKLAELEAVLDELYALPRSFKVRAALDALAAAHVEINQAAAQALLGSEESLGAVETLESIAAHNLTVASHMVILTGVLSKVAGLVASGKKVVEAAKGLADAKV